MKKVTKKAKIAFIRKQLEGNSVWALKALLRIYDNQTEAEQAAGETVEENGIGFTGCDANILTSFAEGYKKYGKLTPKQMELLHRKIGKYATQIYNLSDENKLLACMERQG